MQQLNFKDVLLGPSFNLVYSVSYLARVQKLELFVARSVKGISYFSYKSISQENLVKKQGKAGLFK